MINRYRHMAGDTARVRAFARAIQAVVRPGDVVADIGSGLGTYAILAAKAGAKKVYGIERENIVITARQMAKDNRVADRVEFIRGDACEVRLPGKADVVIFEDFAVTLIDPQTERLVAAARKNLLKRGGRMIPRSVGLLAAPVTCREAYAMVEKWGRSQRTCGVDFSCTREPVMNSIQRVALKASALLSTPASVLALDLRREFTPELDASVRFRCRKSGVMHGIALWFEADLAPRVSLSNAPGRPPTLWGQCLLPLTQPLSVKKGEAISVQLAALRSRDSQDIWWQWSARSSGGAADGTTFRSVPLSKAMLERSEHDRPHLSAEGEVLATCLSLLKKGCTILEVARALRQRFPGRFRTLRDALRRAGDDASRFGQRQE